MRLTLVPAAKPFPGRPPEVHDYCVVGDGERVGRIFQNHGGQRQGQWSWFVMKRRLSTGTEDTLEQAKAAFTAAVSEET